MRLAAVSLALLLAGCAAAPPAGNDGDAGSAEAPLAFTTRGCAVQEILFPLAPEALASFLPEGFEAEAFPAQGMAAVIALVMTCEEPERLEYAMVLIPVTTVPDAWRRDGADAHAVVTSLVVDEGVQFQATFEAWGYGPILSSGTAQMQKTTPEPADAAARAGRAEAAHGTGARFSIDTTVRGVPRTDEGNFIRFFMAHERQVLGAWDGDLTEDHRVHSGEAHMEASAYPPLPATAAGLGFHEFADLVTWTRVPAPVG